jgi:hypothetical protein
LLASPHRVRPIPLRHGLECPLLLHGIEGRDFEILSPQAREIGFREADDLRAPGRGFGQEPSDLLQAFIEGRGDAGRRQGNDHR